MRLRGDYIFIFNRYCVIKIHRFTNSFPRICGNGPIQYAVIDLFCLHAAHTGKSQVNTFDL